MAPGSSVNVLIHDAQTSSTPDEYDLRIQRTGCFSQHNAMLDCHFRTKDWRQCTAEMKAFRACFEKHQNERAQKSIVERAQESVKIDRSENEQSRAQREPTLYTPEWERAPWSSDLIPLGGVGSAPTPRYQTRIKLLWDASYLYFGAEMQEPNVWTSLLQDNLPLYKQNNVEFFLDPDRDGRNYFEFEANAAGTTWQLSLPLPYDQGGVPVDPDPVGGLVTAVYVNGTLNDAAGTPDVGWSITVAMPWAGLRKYMVANQTLTAPPRPGDAWAAQFARTEWPFKLSANASYERVPGMELDGAPLPVDGQWSWASQGVTGTLHHPEMWGTVVFGAAEGSAGPTTAVAAVSGGVASAVVSGAAASPDVSAPIRSDAGTPNTGASASTSKSPAFNLLPGVMLLLVGLFSV
ncbi:hypothetical protein BC830DRAFT_1163733 [Chytriomyces sp. MP71]|nr:hypothetical protein BC830DRAFT_1163733 [Chytriomyces sp. MP71]